MYSQILVPTDGSPASDAAIEHAIDLARRYDATLHALYVVDGAAYSTLEAGAEVVVDALESEGDAATRRVADAAAEGIALFELAGYQQLLDRFLLEVSR